MIPLAISNCKKLRILGKLFFSAHEKTEALIVKKTQKFLIGQNIETRQPNYGTINYIGNRNTVPIRAQGKGT